MADTPMAAVSAHADAINSKRGDRTAETVWFPFLHMQPDGAKIWFESAADMPAGSTPPFSRTEVREVEILAASGDLVVYALTFQRYDDRGEPALLVQGLWGVHRVAGVWKVGWRQYLGEV